MEENTQTEMAAEPGADAAPDSAPMINVTGGQFEIVPDDDSDQMKIALGEFEGPLDLLLYLIRQEQINIYDIPIARITDEYLRYLNLMQELDLALAGDFLVMAAQLIEMKSRMLLPRDPLEEEEALIDARAELVDRLLEHQKFKAAAEVLWSRATVERAVFTRAELETDKTNPEVAVGLFDLLTVFQEILARHKEEVLMEIEREGVTMADMIERLRNMVRSAGEVNLRNFFERAQSRRELVVAFLSLLALVRIAECDARNRGLERREIAGGWQIATRPEHHEQVRAYLKSKPSAKLSLASLETLAVIAYKQPVTVPEILEIRGVQSPSAIKTLLDKRLIVARGRKETVGRPMMYGTSKEFLIQFGLKDLTELPSIEDFQDLAGGGE